MGAHGATEAAEPTHQLQLHLFVKFSPQEYYYQGVFELVDYTYEDEKDEDGNIRKEYKFRLRKVSAQ